MATTAAAAAAAGAALRKFLPLLLLVLVLQIQPSRAVVESGCDTGNKEPCHNRPVALRLKVIAIPSILVASMIGVCLPLFSRRVPLLRPERDFFVVVKAFASGVILSTGFMHVLPDSFEMLSSPCLPETPWGKFPFTTFIAMLSAVFTLMMDSFLTTFQSRSSKKNAIVGITDTLSHHRPAETSGLASISATVPPPQLADDASHKGATAENTLLRYRIIAQVLEIGIVVHSVVIGLSMGASESPCTIRPLVAALCFHQLFEGMGLGGCILQAEYSATVNAWMVFFFATTTPFGIALGIALTKVYSENSPTALIVVGVLNASSAGLLIYMALVDLLAADFLGPRLQGKAGLQAWAYLAVLLGMGGMSLMAKWA